MKSVDSALVRKVAAEFGTPCYVYFAEVMRERVRRLSSFDVVRYAQKACSNVHLLRLLRGEGVQIDAVSLGEIERALRAGFRPGGDGRAEIVFTADVVDRATLRRVIELGIPMNAGSIDMLAQLGEQRRGHPVWLRINPGFGHGHSRKTNTGGESSKHGIWHEEVRAALAVVDRFDLDLVGLHMHIGSGADLGHLAQVSDAMLDQVQRLGRDIHAISTGGGLSVPYRETDPSIDVEGHCRVWNDARRRIEAIVGHPVELEIEPGRYLVAESGILIAEVRAVKRQGTNRFVLADAGFNDLMRPALYGSHHEISVLGQSDECAALRVPLLVGGPLCESGDVFTQGEGGVVLPRELPEPRVGDLLVFHDTGAYGASMASNYNSRPYAPEVLVDGDGSVRLVRRRQRVEDLLALEDV